MDYYIDISLLSDPELPVPVLMNALYSKFHKALYDLGATDIGISFPKYNQNLGNILRLHGAAEALKKLQNLNWVGPMAGYCEIGGITPVPDEVSYRTVFRRQPTMSQAKLRRLIQRGSINDDAAYQYKTKMFSRSLNAPYVQLKSSSTGSHHRRYIEMGPMEERPVIGKFDQFGLSRTATIPWF